jgi:uncharacterized protein (TIGR00290 family)
VTAEPQGNAMTTTTPSAAISWSGGKDGCLALLHAREAGVAVTTYVTACDPGGDTRGHRLPRALVAAQVQALGGRWWPLEAGFADYGERFDATLRALRACGHTQMVFGDIDLQAHRDWLEPRCRAAGIEALFPLWGLARAEVARQIIARGIRARLVVVDARRLDASFCGADYDAALLARLPADVCPCGEGGEFHTFVGDAPGFAAPLRVVAGPVRELAAAPKLAPTPQWVQALRLAPQ